MLSQVGRGAVLLSSMALVACYIDVYSTGKFPWQHAAAADGAPTTISAPEFVSDPAVQPAQDVAEHPGPVQQVFLPGSKSDVANSAALEQMPAYAPPKTATTPPVVTPVFLSGSKSFSGQTTVLSGALSKAESADGKPAQGGQIDVSRYSPMFMSASKSSPAGPAIGVYPVLIFAPQRASDEPVQMPGTGSGPTTVPPFNRPHVGDTQAPGTVLSPGWSQPTIPQTAPPGISTASYPQSPTQGPSSFRPNVSPSPEAAPANTPPLKNADPPLYMSGAKSPIRTTDINSFDKPVSATNTDLPNAAKVPNQPPQFMGGSKSMALPPRLPEAATPAVSPEKLQFMGGSKSVGPAAINLYTVPSPLEIKAPSNPLGLPTSPPQQDKSLSNPAPSNNANAPHSTPQFMGGAKSPGPLAMPSSTPSPRVQTPTRIPGQLKPIANLPPLPVSQQQQAVPLKITPPNAPVSPARSY